MMTKERTEPRAWVGCLGCYNAGRLVGAWVDGREAEAIPDALAIDATYTTSDGTPSTAGYRACRACGGDEWWVLDHEGYGRLLSGECSPAEAQRLAELFDEVEDPDAFAAWVDVTDPDEPDADSFDEAYCGRWDAIEDYAEELVEDIGLLEGVPETVARYFDLAAFARDLELGGDVYAVPDGAGGVYVFDGHA